MTRFGWVAAIAAVAVVPMAGPAQAQFFFQSKDLSGGAVRGDEPDLGLDMPGATPEELRAGLTWTLRAALNVAALQCQFEPTLLTTSNYNAVIKDHDDELDKAMATMTAYETRVNNKNKALGQTAFDHYNTRMYSAYATVSAQYGFCQTAARVGQDAIFAPRGHLGDIAEEHMRELRNSLVPFGEQRFPARWAHAAAPLPRLDAICWSKKGDWVVKKCGALNWPPAGVGLAAN